MSATKSVAFAYVVIVLIALAFVMPGEDTCPDAAGVCHYEPPHF